MFILTRNQSDSTFPKSNRCVPNISLKFHNNSITGCFSTRIKFSLIFFFKVWINEFVGSQKYVSAIASCFSFLHLTFFFNLNNFTIIRRNRSHHFFFYYLKIQPFLYSYKFQVIFNRMNCYFCRFKNVNLKKNLSF